MNDKIEEKKNATEISDIVAEIRPIEILHPKTEEPVGIRVTLLPISDPSLQRLRRQIQDERNRQAAKGKFIKAEEQDDFSIRIATTAIQSWEWYNATFHGEQPTLNVKNVRRVCEELPWFLEQIDEAVGDVKAFFQN